MADKTTTLKTKTNDNVYPNIIGDNMDNAIVDSAHINHTLTKDHKINFRLDTNVSGLIFNSLQKPTGLTKTELVGVGANGQENIEIGDNLTLANGKLSATGGGSGGGDFDVITLLDDNSTYTGTITGTKPVLVKSNDGTSVCTICSNNMALNYIMFLNEIDNELMVITRTYTNGELSDSSIYLQSKTYSHFITMINSSSNISLYLTIQNTYDAELTSNTLAEYLAGKKVLVNGNLHGVVPTYIAGENGIIKIYYRTPGDSNINPTPDVYQDLSSFNFTDLVTPVGMN